MTFEQETIIPCEHDGEKTKIKIDYCNGIQTLSACKSCLDFMKKFQTVKILEVFN